ncbi:MAG: hypothetical protein AAFR79_06670 [Pseudomonadota bacterium]
MAIIRLSVFEDGIFAPAADGTLDTRPYSGNRGTDRRGTGHLGLVPRDTLTVSDDPLRRYLERSLAVEAASLPETAPIVIMVHGWDFDPALAPISPPWHRKAGNPHARLYHTVAPGDEDTATTQSQETEMRHHSTSWPLGLGIATEDEGASGLAIAFGWDSAPSWLSSLVSHGLNPYARAYELAEPAAWHLVAVIEALSTLLPGRPIDLFCHSLGSRVVVRALAMAADLPVAAPLRPRLQKTVASVGRVVLLAGAERVMEAQLMMRRLNKVRAGVVPDDARTNAVFPRIPEFYNIVSRENDVLDKLGENFGPAAPGSKQVIGHNGLEQMDPAWVDIRLDDPAVAGWFRDHPGGYRVSGDNTGVFAVMDHWIHFTWRENMRLYHDILRDRGAWTVAGMKQDPAGHFARPIIQRRPMVG